MESFHDGALRAALGIQEEPLIHTDDLHGAPLRSMKAPERRCVSLGLEQKLR